MSLLISFVVAMKVILVYESYATARRLGGVSRGHVYITMCKYIKTFFMLYLKIKYMLVTLEPFSHYLVKRQIGDPGLFEYVFLSPLSESNPPSCAILLFINIKTQYFELVFTRFFRLKSDPSSLFYSQAFTVSDKLVQQCLFFQHHDAWKSILGRGHC